MTRLQYLVCATPRSGSGLLCDALRSTHVAGDPQEWFARGVVHHQLGVWHIRDPGSTPEQPVMRAGGDYPQRVRTAATVDGVFALKLHWNQWEYFAGSGILPGLACLLVDDAEPLRAVVIRRQNLVDQAVSNLIAQSTYVFLHRRGEAARPALGFEHLPQAEPRYDYEWLLDQIIRLAEHESAWLGFLTEWDIPYHQVYYEDLVADLPAVCGDTLRFLRVRVPGRPPEPELEKQSGPLNREFADRFRRDFEGTATAGTLPGWLLERFGMYARRQ